MKRLFALFLVIILLGCSVVASAAGFLSDPDAIEEAVKSVLMLETFDSSNRSVASGSAFVLFDNMTLVTNYHVIEDASLIIADSDDGYQYFVTKVLIASKEQDIAILQFMAPTVMKPLDYSLDTVKRGSSIAAIGSPIGLKNTVSMGNVSSVYTEKDVDWIQFTAPISHGSSGGALLDDNGKVIGMTSAFYTEGQNLNLAVSIIDIVKLYEKWDKKTAYDIADYQKAVYTDPTSTPSPSPTPSSTPTPSPTATSSPTPTPSPTPSPTPTMTPSPTPIPTSTPSPSPTPSPMPTPSPSPTPQRIHEEENTGALIDLGVDEVYLFVKEKYSLKPQLTLTSDEVQDQTLQYTFSSSDEQIATINSSGTITAVSAGDAVITCFLEENENVYSLLFLHIVEPIAKLSVSESDLTLLLNAVTEGKDQTDLTVIFEPENAFCKDILWSSDNPEVVTVDEKGHLTAIKTGKATITALSAEQSEKPKKATCKVTVANAVEKIESIGDTAFSINIGKTKTIKKPTVSPENAGSKKLVWVSSDPEIATVNSDGQVKAIAVGNCQILCEAADGGGASFAYDVTVVQPVTKLEASKKELRVRAERTASLSTLISVSPKNATNTKLNWTLKNKNGIVLSRTLRYFSISNNVLEFFIPGKYTLTATTTDGSNLSATITVYVEPKNGVTLFFDDGAYATWEYLSGDKLSFKAQVTNREYGKTVKTFELYVYATDAWGNDIYGDYVYYGTTTKNVSPGSTVYSDSLVIPDRSKIYNVYCGIHKILYDDGTSVTIDDINYCYWTIN